MQFVFSLAVAITLSAANVFYRDIGNLARHVLRIWFYLSPILYSADVILKSAFAKSHHWVGRSSTTSTRGPTSSRRTAT